MDNVIDFINVNRERYLDELKALLAIPSISALPEHAADVQALRRLVRRRDAPHRPAERPARSTRRAIRSSTATGSARRARRRSCSTATTTCSRSIRSNLWESPPFEATIRDGEIYARGSADDKGQVFMHFKAIEAHLKQNGRLPVNMKFILEGEEEVGSAQPRRLHPRPQGRARTPTSSSSPTRRCSRAACRRSATACAAWSTSRSICAAAAPTCTRDRSAARSRIRRSSSRR